MGAFLAALVWCALHLTLFLALRRSLRSEWAIFGFHLVSFVTFAVIAFTLLLWGDVPIIVAGGVLALHGIYSLSFLELWSLAQGGYSLSILQVLAAGGATRQELAQRFARLGDVKKRERLAALQHGGLIVRSSPFAPTRSGRALATVIGTFRGLANCQSAG